MHRKTKITIAAALSPLLVLLWTEGDVAGVIQAHAQVTVLPTGIQQTFVQTATMIITILNFIGFLILRFYELLFSPEITGGTGPGNVQLNQIWQFSRDVMNVILAIILVIGAIVTVVTANPQYIRDKIVKFILAVILVNFSWFAPRVILDVANVMTATVFHLPSVMNSNCTDCKIIVEMKIFPDPNTEEDTICEQGVLDEKLLKMGLLKLCYDNLDEDTNTPYGIISGLIVNHARLRSLAELCTPAGDLAQVFQLARLMIVTALVLFFHILIIFPMIAIAAVMIVRIPILWLTTAFMPFAFIGWVWGPIANIDTTDLIFKQFIKAAFLPVAIAVPLALGFIMLNSLQTLPPNWIPGDIAAEMPPLVCGISTPWLLLWLLIAFMVVWSGVFMATQIDNIYQGVASNIQSVGKSWFKLPLQIPLPLGNTSGGPDGGKGGPPPRIDDFIGTLRDPKSFFDAKDAQTAAAQQGDKPKAASAAVQQAVTNNHNEFRTTFNQINKMGAGPASQEQINTIRDLMQRNNIKTKEELFQVAEKIGFKGVEMENIKNKLSPHIRD